MFFFISFYLLQSSLKNNVDVVPPFKETSDGKKRIES